MIWVTNMYTYVTYSVCLPLHLGVHPRHDGDPAGGEWQSGEHHDHAQPAARHIQGEEKQARMGAFFYIGHKH